MEVGTVWLAGGGGGMFMANFLGVEEEVTFSCRRAYTFLLCSVSLAQTSPNMGVAAFRPSNSPSTNLAFQVSMSLLHVTTFASITFACHTLFKFLQHSCTLFPAPWEPSF